MADRPIIFSGPMPVITLHQPWASLIAVGAKPFETRSFPPPAKYIGQRIAIHAAVKPPHLIWRAMDWSTTQAAAEALLAAGITGCDELPLGAVVCTAVLAGAYQCGRAQGGGRAAVIDVAGDPDVLRAISFKTDPFGDYSHGRWAWLLTDVEQLAVPVPAKGKQGWWKWNPSEVAA